MTSELNFNQIKKAKEKLKNRIINLNVNELKATPYFKSYLELYIDDLESVLNRHSFILSKAVSGDTNLNGVSLLDFGGGTGLISLISKLSGIGKVTYLDISDEMTEGAKNLANMLGIKIDEFLTGSYEMLPESEYNVIISYDVIEHVYDIEKTLNSLYSKLSKDGIMIMASGANPLNPKVRRKLINNHKQLELSIRPKGKKRDCNKAYFYERMNIAKEYSAKVGVKLNKENLEKIALQTRGKIREEIEQLLKSIDNNGIKSITGVPEIKNFEKIFYLNTCDPYTGNWGERLMHPKLLAKELQKYLFSVSIEAGLYHGSHSFIKRYLNLLFNIIIKLIPGFKLWFSPYYIIKICK